MMIASGVGLLWAVSLSFSQKADTWSVLSPTDFLGLHDVKKKKHNCSRQLTTSAPTPLITTVFSKTEPARYEENQRKSPCPAKNEETTTPTTTPTKAEEKWRAVVATTPAPVPQKRKPLKGLALNAWYIEKLAHVLYPAEARWLTAFITACLVAPLTVITPLEREYQQYLLEIFHIKPLTRIAHVSSTPFITWAYLLMAGSYGPAILESVSCGGSPMVCALSSIRLNLVVALVFFFWWMIWAFRAKARTLMILMSAYLVLMWTTSNVYTYYWAHHWTHYWWNEPFFWGFFFTTIQTLSHIAEGNIPPRANETDRWMSLNEFRSLHSGWHFLVVTVRAGLCGGVNEFFAAPRIFPMQQLSLLYWLGYKPEQKRELDQLVALALKDQNPALDYVGSGGSLPPAIQEAPKSLCDAQEELELLYERAARNYGHVDEDDFARMDYLQDLIHKATAQPLAQPTVSPRPLCLGLEEMEATFEPSPRSRN